MSDLQKEASSASATGRIYQKISPAFDRMPDRFKLVDLLLDAGIKDGVQVRSAASAVLYRIFHCISVETESGRLWKKPEARS